MVRGTACRDDAGMTAAPEDPDVAPSDTQGPVLPPPVVAGAGALAQLALSRGARSTPASRTAAGILAAGGLALMGSAAVTLVRERTTVSPHRLSGATALVRTGPFRRSRNPIYLGIVGLLLARAVDRRSWPALLPAALFAAVMDRSQIPAEEEALRALFGAEYEDYLREVARWWGGPRGPQSAGGRIARKYQVRRSGAASFGVKAGVCAT